MHHTYIDNWKVEVIFENMLQLLNCAVLSSVLKP